MDGLSGITWRGGDLYDAVSDADGYVYRLQIQINEENGKIKSCKKISSFHVDDATDLEGCAWDPLRENLWIVDEWDQRIFACNEQGNVTKGIEILPLFTGDNIRYLMGFESLSIRSDGMEMWTANEEALMGDGDGSSKSEGSLVRLVRLLPTSLTNEFYISEQYAYRVDPVAGSPYQNIQRSGISDLCVLDNGSLLVLEREMSRVNLIPRFRCRIYVVDFIGADEVTKFPELRGKQIQPVKKELLYEYAGFSMYEGICLGPKLKDGSRILIMVSDGDDGGLQKVASLRLHDKNAKPEPTYP